MLPPDLATARRIVVKIGYALVVDPATAAPRADWLASVAEDAARLRAGGAEVVLVSSGAVALARHALGLTRRSLRLEEKQAAAAVGQGPATPLLTEQAVRSVRGAGPPRTAPRWASGCQQGIGR